MRLSDEVNLLRAGGPGSGRRPEGGSKHPDAWGVKNPAHPALHDTLTKAGFYHDRNDSTGNSHYKRESMFGRPLGHVQVDKTGNWALKDMKWGGKDKGTGAESFSTRWKDNKRGIRDAP
jgi:hypothetical protein